MTAIISFTGLKDKNIGLQYLENGETVLERQIRLLEHCGIDNFFVTGISSETLSNIYENRKKNTNIQIFDNIKALQQALADFSENVLFVGGQTVFTSNAIKNMLQNEMTCQTFINKDPSLKKNWLRAKVEMKTLVDISSSGNGTGWFAHIPIYKLGIEAAQKFLSLLNDALPLEEAAKKLLSAFPIHYIDCSTPDIFANVIATKTFKNVKQQVTQADIAAQNIIRDDCSILKLTEIINETEAQRPFIVYDDCFSSLPVDYITDKFDCTMFSISGTPDYDVIKNGVTTFLQNKSDIIISIGSNGAIEAGKLIKAFSVFNQNESYLTQPFRYSSVTHAAVPSDLKSGVESNLSASILLENSNSHRTLTFSHCTLMPDYAILNESIILYVKPEEDFKENNAEKRPLLKKKKVSFKMRIKSGILQLFKIVLPIYDAAIYVWRKALFNYYHFKTGIDYRAVVFEAFLGKFYRCNPRALYEQMLADEAYSGFKFVWSVNNPKKYAYLKNNPNTTVVKRHSKAYIKACATSKYIISNYGFPSYVKKNNNRLLIHTWHGKPLKRICYDFAGEISDPKNTHYRNKRTKKQRFNFYKKTGGNLSSLFSPAPVFSKNMVSAFNLTASNNVKAVIETGYPRNDFLFRYTQEDILKIKIKLGIPLNKKVILYVPTWRPYNYIGSRSYEYNNQLDFESLYQKLGENYVFLFRTHDLEKSSIDFANLAGFIYDVTTVEDVNELYIISDLMISDYSGAIFDFANLRRPMVFYMYDLDQYTQNASGLYFPVDMLPGKIVSRQEEIASAIKEQLAGFTYDEKYQNFNETYNCLDGAACSEQVLKQIIDLEALPNSLFEKRKKQQVIYSNFKNFFQIKIPGFFRGHGICLSENSKKLASYKNKHKSQRCFLVGNGPSLTMSDLEMIKDEITFGCNLIYKVFDSVEWRPTYICLSDLIFARTIAEDLSELNIALFTNYTAYRLMKTKPSSAVYVNKISSEKYYVRGNIMNYYVPSASTVMTFMIELAMYMGFSEIYLIGVDCTHSFFNARHFTDNYLDNSMKKLEKQRILRKFSGERNKEKIDELTQDRAIFAYSKLAQYADKKGYKVYNATRGGMLEVFERVNLDDILKNKNN